MGIDIFLWTFVFVIIYVILLFTLKALGVGHKKRNENCTNSCPDCKNAMERIKRLQGDYLVNHFTFHIFNYKRYRCMDCGWEGLRWEKQFKPGRN